MRKHSCIHHKCHIRVRPNPRVHALWGGGDLGGQDLGHIFLRMTILFSFQSRTEDLTHNVRAYVLDWVYMSALYPL